VNRTSPPEALWGGSMFPPMNCAACQARYLDVATRRCVFGGPFRFKPFEDGRSSPPAACLSKVVAKETALR